VSDYVLEGDEDYPSVEVCDDGDAVTLVQDEPPVDEYGRRASGPPVRQLVCLSGEQFRTLIRRAIDELL